MILDILRGIRDSLVIVPHMRRMAATWHDVAFDPVSMDNFDWMDLQALESYEREFVALGFEPLGDFSPRLQSNAAIGCMRLLGHPAEKAFVSLHVTKPAGKAAQSLRCAIICDLSDGWSVTGTDREADSFLHQLRLPRAVGLRDCDVSQADLWSETLKLRNQLMTEKNLQVVGNARFEDFMTFTARTNGERAELLLGRNPLLFAIRRRLYMRKGSPRRELWTGAWKRAS